MKFKIFFYRFDMTRILLTKTLEVANDLIDLEESVPVPFGGRQGSIIDQRPHVIDHLVLRHNQPPLLLEVPLHALSELTLTHRAHEAPRIVVEKEEHIRGVDDERREDDVRLGEQLKDHVLERFLLLVLLADTLTSGVVNLVVLVGLLVILGNLVRIVKDSNEDVKENGHNHKDEQQIEHNGHLWMELLEVVVIETVEGGREHVQKVSRSRRQSEEVASIKTMTEEHKPIDKDNEHSKEEDDTDGTVAKGGPQDHDTTDEREVVEHGDDTKERGVRRGVDPVLLGVALVVDVVEEIPALLNFDLVVADEDVPDETDNVEYDIAEIHEIEEIDKERLEEGFDVRLGLYLLGTNFDPLVGREFDVHSDTIVLKSVDVEL